MLRYVWRELVRNPRRTLVSMVGVALGVGLFSGVLFFNDGSAASLTRRAIAPVTLDMQRVLTSPLGRPLVFDERLSVPPGSLAEGADAELVLSVANRGTAPANEVVLNDEPPPPLSYVQGTTVRDGQPVADVVGQSPLAQGLARTGLNIGTLAPGATTTITYKARASRAIPDVATLMPRGTVSTRESVLPLAANAPAAVPLADLASAIRTIPGVAAADGLYFVDLPVGSVRAGVTAIDAPVRVFAFTPDYQVHHPSIRVVSGSFADESAVLSIEAARVLGLEPGATVTMALAGGAAPLALAVSGVADLTRATPLFSSRKSTTLEDFFYVAHSVVVSPDLFERVVMPAYREASTRRGTPTQSLPVLEVDVMVDRSRLGSAPAAALERTTAIERAITALAPGQDYLIDNISNALQVARADAATGSRMFVFLGLPGVVLAAFLAAYASRILTSAQRRDNANLRLRGARPRHLRMIALYRTMIFAGAGSVAGTALGFACVLGVLGSDALLVASLPDLAVSSVTAVVTGTLGASLPSYLAARRALRREIATERREIATDAAPAWRRRRLDVMLVGGAAVAEVVAFAVGAFDRRATSVANGESPSLPSAWLAAPLAAWLGGALLAVRAITWIVSRRALATSPASGSPIRGVLTRSVSRRPWALGTGIAGVCLVTAFGVALVVFAASYDTAKRHDARFVVGGDLRITPSALGTPPTMSDGVRLAGPDVAEVTPVVAALDNAVLIGAHDQERADLAAIDPATFADVASRSDSFFVDRSAAEAFAALAADPRGVLVNVDKADSLSIKTGDRVKVVLARGTDNQTVQELDVVAQFVRFPGFPQGVDLVVDAHMYAQTTGSDHVDFFLGRTSDARGSVQRAVEALASGARDPVHIETTATALDKDQSSLTALDLHGLVRLDGIYTVAMSVATMAIFVLALMLQRRREYALLRAQGMVRRELRALVLGEAGLVAGSGVLAGVVVGIGVARLFVYVLRPLFVLDPPVTLPIARVVALAAVPIVAAIAAALVGEALLAHVEPTELLREP